MEEIGGGLKNFLETDENKNSTYKNLWDTAKPVLRKSFSTMSAYIKNQGDLK
jgi:hypothetical protein